MAKSIKRSSATVPVVMLGLVALARVSLRPTHGDSPTFLAASSGRSAGKARTVMHGFKEDFDEWRASLTPEEKTTLKDQAMGEYNKAYRKTPEFKKNVVPDDKVTALSKILSKFYENEAEEFDAKMTDTRKFEYDGLFKKAGDKTLDMSLRSSIIEVDLDAERRYRFATARAKEGARTGKRFPHTSPREEWWNIPNSNETEHQWNLEFHKAIVEAGQSKDVLPNNKKYIAELQKTGVPAMGEDYAISLPWALTNMIGHYRFIWKRLIQRMLEREDFDDEAMWNYTDVLIPATMNMINNVTAEYYEARAEVDEAVEGVKAFYRTQNDFIGTKKTKADVFKEIWESLQEYMPEKQFPPLDPEMLAEFATLPAMDDDGPNFFTTEDRMYQSEAVDAFGVKYLLGVYKTFDESLAAFEEWNQEYNDARKDMASEMKQWSEQEQAKLDSMEGEGTERIKQMLEEARR